MAKFLDTTGVSHYLTQIIKKAEEKLWLISPYLQVNERIKNALIERDKFNIDIRIIYGKAELSSGELNWIKEIQSIKLFYSKNLHAKCYLSENSVIITSMNLYEYSQQNNLEMGIYVDKEKDFELYKEIFEEVKRINMGSEQQSILIEKVPKEEKIKTSKKITKDIKSEKGHCIRCKKQIKLSPIHPYCRDCFNIWKEFGNEEYEEKHCHICGKQNKSSMKKPTCYPCYKKNKNVLEFPLS